MQETNGIKIAESRQESITHVIRLNIKSQVAAQQIPKYKAFPHSKASYY